ncbi:MAG: prepilin-type cleavage/methylation domain-containing protein [Sideroxydans sp.]|nr:prepilin-type cleavage/methylation domain-containing protein [Sideroxydans sp.]
MKLTNQQSLFKMRGFSLVEIMVGLLIGMLASLVILQVLSVFEKQKRATTGSADAQTNGGIALYNISRELQVAGYPLMPVTDSALECTTLTIDGAAGFDYRRLSPISITNATSDSITIRYGTSFSGGSPSPITAVGAPTPNDVTLTSNLGCQANDRTLIINGATCAMSTATAVVGNTTVKLDNPAGAIAGANISCLGTWNEVAFTVNNGNLERNGTPTVAGVVNLQAQYGISANATSNQIANWVDASGGTWANPTIADRNRIKAIRIAVVARNAKLEEVAVTPNAPTSWTGGPAINLAADGNWQRYRYRVFETIIPLRNMIWAKDTL